MPIESATHITDLNTSNPVGSTDKVQTLDDHVRLIKSVLKTDLNLAGAVTASHSELNILDGATLSTAELNILDGVTLTAAQINEAARLSATNQFTAATLEVRNNGGGALRATDIDNDRMVALRANGSQLTVEYRNAAGTFQAQPVTWSTSGATVTDTLLTSTTITLSGDATVSGTLTCGGNLVTASTLTIAGTGETLATFADDGAVTLYHNNSAKLDTKADGVNVVGEIEADSLDIDGAGDISGALALGSTLGVTGALTAATIANSTSTTLVAGQLHFVSGDATLPNLTAGQWITVINDDSSSHTISKNASDTTFWTLTGATVTTSFTLAARGRLTAVCNPAGTGVYVSGSGITGAT